MLPKTKNRLKAILLCLCFVAVFSAGCDDDDWWDCEGLIEGRAYYPYYLSGLENPPTYYEQQNQGIRIFLYDGDGRLVRETTTGYSGFYSFVDLEEGAYWVAAFYSEYVVEYGTHYVDEAENAGFWLDCHQEVYDYDLFLKFSYNCDTCKADNGIPVL
jgi:hypothetical protein